MAEFLWVLFAASQDEWLLKQLVEQQPGSGVSRYRVDEVIPVVGGCLASCGT
ncbi:MAG: hypothetical protein L0332_33430 [Chloroflexi bacterium]|nr:hypothetical protein [Chloroflexota bacterium]MCI0577297.1 hypothetical protein [Chloroflexota bacterium]MCI0647741.1 hypothetical protein [Chloroflexota bacterium]MCI0731605.1 hypothetical protein [Chloroflexota bacterium]